MNSRHFQWVLAAAALLAFALPAMAQSAAKGEAIYKANCMTCHGADGSGSAVGKSLHAADLGSEKVQSKSDAFLAQFIDNGHGAMPSFSKKLNHGQILDVVQYVRTFAKK